MKMTISVPTRAGTKEVQAEIIGPLAVHPTVHGQKPGWKNWTVTLLDRGLAVATVRYQRTAKALAKEVAARYPDLAVATCTPDVLGELAVIVRRYHEQEGD